MSHAITHLRSPGPRARTVLGFLFVAAALFAIVGLSTTTLLDQGRAAADVPGTATEERVAPAREAPSPGTGVPDASSVFAGREMPVEEPAPTF